MRGGGRRANEDPAGPEGGLGRVDRGWVEEEEIPDPILLHHRGTPNRSPRTMRAAGVRPYTLFYQTWDYRSLKTTGPIRGDHRSMAAVLPPDTRVPAARLRIRVSEALRSDPLGPFPGHARPPLRVFDEVKAAFPNSKLTYYGLPRLQVHQGQRRRFQPPGRPRRRGAAVELARFEAIRPLPDRPTGSPNLYDWKRNATSRRSTGRRWTAIPLADGCPTHEGVRARIGPSRSTGHPMVCIYYVFRGEQTGPTGDAHPDAEFIHDQIVPAIEGGADGLAFWNNDENISTPRSGSRTP